MGFLGFFQILKNDRTKKALQNQFEQSIKKEEDKRIACQANLKELKGQLALATQNQRMMNILGPLLRD